MMSKTSYNQLQTHLRHCTVFWHKWPVHDLVLVIPPPSLIKVASNRRPYSKLGGTTLNGREEGGQYYIYISHTPVNRSDLQQERSFFHGSVSTFLQLVVAPARIQNLFTHVWDIHSYNTRSATTNKFCVMSSSLEQLKNSFSRRFALACGYRMRYHKILKSLPVETYQRNKCMKRFPVLIFLNKRICTLHHLQFLKY